MGWRGALVFFTLGVSLVFPATASAFPCGYQVKTDGRSIPQPPTGLSSSIYLLPGGSLEDVDVMVDVTHPTSSELDITLSHAGRVVSLTTDNGGFGGNYRDTVFDDEAATSITAGSSPFTGSFRPENPLSEFDGLPMSGVWTLTVRDDTGVLDGGGGGSPPPQTLESWGLTFAASSCPSARSPCDESGNSPNVSIGNPGASLLGQTTTGTGTVTDVDVHIRRITAATAADVDLRLFRSGTDGNVLTSDNGGAGDNYVGTIFDDSASVDVEAFAAPFTGRLRPEEPLSLYLNFPVSGVWTLRVDDDNGPGPGAPADVVVNTWGITVKTAGCVDPDGDVVYSTIDNCPSNGNVGQENLDQDAEGNACDTDDDADGTPDANDSCSLGVTGAGGDLDGDGCKSAEDPDDDGDGKPDADDACAAGATGTTDDLDGDGCKSAEDPDDDGDGKPDADDACAAGATGTTDDLDGDGCKDSEDLDDDNDGKADSADLCPSGASGAAPDRDGDGCSDTEDTDNDNDGTPDTTDACSLLSGPPPVGCPTLARTVTLTYSARSRKFSGRVPGPNLGPCATGQPVKLRQVRKGPDPKVGKTLRTSSTGRFSVRRRVKKGRYYAEVSAATVRDVALCAAAKSKPVHVR